MQKHLRWLTIVAAVGMFLVLLGGALVTKSESGRGCGDDWPLCNGKFIPAYTVESMIEYSHRAVSGIVGLFVLAAAIAVWKQRRHDREALFYAFIALGFTVFQAILGALAVVKEQSSAVMALHFGFSLIAFAGSMLLAIYVWHEGDPEWMGWKNGDRSKVNVGKGFRNLIWFNALYTYIVVYLGAYMRHTDSMGGCAGWPLCNGQWIPDLSGATGVAFLHRVAAFLLFLSVGIMAYLASTKYVRHPVLRRGSRWSFGLISAQVLSGGLVAATMGSDNYMFSALIHTVLVSLLFGTLAYMSIQVSPLREKFKASS